MRQILRLAMVAIALTMVTSITAKNHSAEREEREEEQEAEPIKLGALLYCDVMIHDFGEVNRREEEVKHTFVIENRGDEPLTIVRVERSCSCMKVNLSRRPIAVGESREMKVTYELKKMPPGIFSKVVQIYSTSRDEGFNQFTICGRSVQTDRKE